MTVVTIERDEYHKAKAKRMSECFFSAALSETPQTKEANFSLLVIARQIDVFCAAYALRFLTLFGVGLVSIKMIGW